MREQRRKDAVWRFLTYAFVITMVVVMMVPLYWMLVAATLPQEQFLQFPPRLIPRNGVPRQLRGAPRAV